MAKRSKYTRSGARRAGDDYQDLMAIKFAIDMLSHPTRYSWMQLECDDVGALDDVVLLAADRRLVLRQVKHSTNPTLESDPWTWDTLLHRKRSKAKSLIEKWVSGFVKAEKSMSSSGAQELDAKVVSNRSLSPDIESCIRSERIEISLIPKETLEKIHEQVEAVSFRRFAESCVWHTDFSDYDDFKESLKRRFFALGGTSEGWYSLESSIRDWVRLRDSPPPDGKISLHHVRDAAKWSPLESLPQSFEVPKYFVVPDSSFHANLRAKIADHSQSCITLTGGPGVGKSTYISYLVDELQRDQIPVLRHHYWLSSLDDRLTRLHFEKVANSLMADLEKHYPDAISSSCGKNPTADELRDWLDEAAQHFSDNSQRLILILDGLDHVWRESNQAKEELGRILDQVPVHDGLLLILGTQELDDTELPPLMLRRSPRESWLRLPELDSRGISSILRIHRDELELPTDEQHFENVVSQLLPALIDIGCSHPLFLRYTLEYTKSEGIPLTSGNIYRLPICPGNDIIQYYRNTLIRLDAAATLALQLIVEAPFPLSATEIETCLVQSGTDLTSAKSGFRSVRHLLGGTGTGWTVFHGSIRQYILDEDSYMSSRSRLRSTLLLWLSQLADDERRWAYEWPLNAEWEGEDEMLRRGPDRHWAIESIVRGRPLRTAQRLLRDSALASLRAKDFESFVRVGLLENYVEIGSDYYNHLRFRFMAPLLNAPGNSRLYDELLGRLDTLDSEELLELLRYDHKIHGGSNSPRIFDQLLELKKNLQRSNVHRETEGWGEANESILRACAYVESGLATVGQLFQDLTNKAGDVVLAKAARELVRTVSLSKLRALLKATPRDSKQAVARYLFLCAIEEGISAGSDFSNLHGKIYPLEYIYRRLGDDAFAATAIAFPSPSCLAQDSVFLMHSQELLIEWTIEFFWACAASALADQVDAICSEIESCRADPWTTKFLEKLAEAGKTVGRAIASGTAVSTADFYRSFIELPEKPWQPGEPGYQFSKSVNAAVARISIDIVRILGTRTLEFSISSLDIVDSSESPVFNVSRWLDEYLLEDRPYLKESDIEATLTRLLDEERDAVCEAQEKVEQYARIAGVAAMHDLGELVEQALRAASGAFLSHYWRKDVLFFTVLNVIDTCASVDQPLAQRSLLRIAPALIHSRKYTDGSETDGLPGQLADCLARHALDFVPEYYLWLVGEERYDDAEGVVHALIEHAELGDTVLRDIISSAIDSGSVASLAERLEGTLSDFASFQPLMPYMTSESDKSSERSVNSDVVGDLDATSNSDESFLPENYPPDKIDELISLFKSNYRLERCRALGDWIRFWSRSVEQTRLLSLLVQAKKRNEDIISSRHIYELMRSCEGRGASYPWLCQSYIEGRHWNYFMSDKESMRWHWDRLKSDLPVRWFDFLISTFEGSLYLPDKHINPHFTLSRIAEYLILFGQNDLAVQLCGALVDESMSYVAFLPLERPVWCRTN